MVGPALSALQAVFAQVIRLQREPGRHQAVEARASAESRDRLGELKDAKYATSLVCGELALFGDLLGF